MKKILSTICGLSMIAGTAFADEPAVSVDLNTPVRWYARALSQSFFTPLYGGKGDNIDTAYEQTMAFMKTMTITDGIVTLSPAEIVERCMSVYQGNDAPDFCSYVLVNAIRRHNKLVAEYTSLAFVSLNDTGTKIKWTRADWYGDIETVFGYDYRGFFVEFNDYMKSVNDTASLDDVRAKCESILQDEEIARRVNANSSTCQKFVETMIKRHNGDIKTYSAEQMIGQ